MILALHHKKLVDAEHMLQDLLLNSNDGEDDSMSDVRFNLARVLMRQNRDGEAEEIFTQQLRKCDDPFGVPHKVLSTSLCRALRKQGKFAEAEVVARQASDIVPIHGPADIRSQCALLALGKVKLAQREYGEAASILRQACDAIATPYHITHLGCQMSMGAALKHLGCYEESISFYARALDGCIRMLGVGHHSARNCSRELDECRALLEKGQEIEE
jgi:tetratricopeptide (TPR) repeat protein